MSKLTTWARSVAGRSGGTTFSSKEALATYARAHPAADMSKHSVAASAPKAAAPAAANRPAAPALLPPPGPRPQTLREVNQQAKAHAETAYQSSKAANKTNTPEAHAAAAAAHDVAALHAGSSAAVLNLELRGHGGLLLGARLRGRRLGGQDLALGETASLQ
jgi:hypothetical protein